MNNKVSKTKEYIREKYRKNKGHGKNIVLVNISYFVSVLYSLIISVILTNYVGADTYGKYIFVYGIVGLVSLLSIPGTKSTVFKNVAQGYYQVFAYATKLSFSWSLIQIPLLLVLSLIFSQTDHVVGNALLIIAFFAPFHNGLLTWQTYLKGNLEIVRYFVYTILMYTLMISTTIILITVTNNILYIILAQFIIEVIFNLIITFDIVSRIKKGRGIKDNLIVSSESLESLQRRWKKQSYALTILDFTNVIFGRLDILIIGLLLTPEKLAVYNIVMKLGALLNSIIKESIDALSPLLYKAKNFSIRFLSSGVILSSLFALVSFFLIHIPIDLLYQNNLEGLVELSQLYLLSLPGFFISKYIMTMMIKQELNRQINISSILGIIFLVVFYFIMINSFGIVGGIFTSILYYYFMSLINGLQLRKALRLISE